MSTDYAMPATYVMPTNAEPREIAVLDQAIHTLERATSLNEIKSIRDKAQAVRSYAHAAKMGLKALNHAAEVKLLAERKAGRFLASLKLRGGDRKTSSQHNRLNLSDLGITQNESKRWQKLAEVPEDIFQRYVKATNELGRELTAAGLMRLVKEPKRPARTQNRGPSCVKAAINRSNRSISGPEELLTDLNNHCQLLASVLKPLYEETETIGFRKIERRTVGRLLCEMNSTIKQLQQEMGTK